MVNYDDKPTNGAFRFLQSSKRVSHNRYVVYLDDEGREVVRHRSRGAMQ